MPVFAQESDIAYVIQKDERMIYVGERDIDMSEALWDWNVRGWNPTGDYFMTLIQDPNDPSREIMLIHDLTVPEAFPLQTDIDFGITNVMSFGTNSVLFTEWTEDMILLEDEQGIGVIRINVYEWAFEEGLSAVEPIGSVPYGIGCGGSGIRSTLDNVYRREVKGDTYGEYNRRVFTSTPHGIVHSNSCTAICTMVTNPDTANAFEIGSNLRWSVVSPDGNWVAGTEGNTLVLGDLLTFATSEIYESDAPVHSMTWSADSQHLYFVGRTLTDELLTANTLDDILPTLDPNRIDFPVENDFYRWQSTIYHYDRDTETLTALHEADAYAIGQMTLVNDSLVFNQIGHPTAWLQAFIDDGDFYDPNLIPVTLWQLDLMTGDATQVGEDLRGIWVQPR